MDSLWTPKEKIVPGTSREYLLVTFFFFFGTNDRLTDFKCSFKKKKNQNAKLRLLSFQRTMIFFQCRCFKEVVHYGNIFFDKIDKNPYL